MSSRGPPISTKGSPMSDQKSCYVGQTRASYVNQGFLHQLENLFWPEGLLEQLVGLHYQSGASYVAPRASYISQGTFCDYSLEGLLCRPESLLYQLEGL